MIQEHCPQAAAEVQKRRLSCEDVRAFAEEQSAHSAVRGRSGGSGVDESIVRGGTGAAGTAGSGESDTREVLVEEAEEYRAIGLDVVLGCSTDLSTGTAAEAAPVQQHSLAAIDSQCWPVLALGWGWRLRSRAAEAAEAVALALGMLGDSGCISLPR